MLESLIIWFTLSFIWHLCWCVVGLRMRNEYYNKYISKMMYYKYGDKKATYKWQQYKLVYANPITNNIRLKHKKSEYVLTEYHVMIVLFDPYTWIVPIKVVTDAKKKVIY